jgi:hypothetical protein
MSSYLLSPLTKEYIEKREMRRTHLSQSPNIFEKLQKCKKKIITFK